VSGTGQRNRKWLILKANFPERGLLCPYGKVLPFMNYIPFIVSWGALATVVIVLAVYRKMVASKEDDFLHVDGGHAGAVEQQAIVAKKLDAIDRWGKGLTILAFVYALLIGGLFMYNAWVEGGTKIQY
jgi:hypothetical protein